MADQIIRPADLPTERSTPVPSEWMVVDNGVTVAKSHIVDVVTAGRPTVTEAKAIAGTDAFDAMTAVATKQSIASEVGVTLASKAQGDKADNAVPVTRVISAGAGLAGGGALSADREIALSSGSVASLAKADTAVQPGALGSLAAKNSVNNSDWSGTPLAPANGGLIPGGTTGQALIKVSASDYDATWQAVAAATAVSYAPQTLTESQKAQARTNIYAASRMDIRRNMSVNGSLLVSAENGDTLGASNGYFYADQKALYRSADLASKISAQRVAYTSLSGGSKAGEFKCVSTATLISTSLATDTDFIEGSDPEFVAAGWGAAGAKPIMRRIEVQKPAGTYSVHVTNRAANRHCWVPYTVTAGEANTKIVKEIQIPGDTSGTWSKADGEIGATIDDVLALGSSLVGGTAGVWGASAFYGGAGQKNFLDNTANVARHTDFGLRLDPDNTGVYGVYRVGEVDAVYRSERYWWQIGPGFPIGTRGYTGMGTGANNGAFGIPAPVAMAKTTLVSSFSNFSIGYVGGSSAVLSILSASCQGNMISLGLNAATAPTDGLLQLRFGATTDRLFFNARPS